MIYRFGFYGLMAAILILSLLPIEHPDISPNDKLNHLIAYGGLMIAGYLGYRNVRWIIPVVFSFGVLVELLQGLTGYRYMSFADVLANGAGIVVGVCCIGLVIGIRRFNILKGSSNE